MASLQLEQIEYRYTGFTLQDISFALPTGSVGVLVGASGSGKTTLLSLIAGFMMPGQGRIMIGGQRVAEAGSGMAPNKRGVGLVFQQHALFPHLCVADNIVFGCPESGRGREKILAGLLADFHIESLSRRYPHELSGGEQQRVALARALAAGPRVLLMDEPFSSIDNTLRRELRKECIDVLRKAGVTCLIVTHDAEEALELADQIVVIDGGKLVQTGTPHALYHSPVNATVAGLFGEINAIHDPKIIASLSESKEPLLIRPESLMLSVSGGVLSGVISHIYFRGSYQLVHVRVSGSEVTLKVSCEGTSHFSVGQDVTIHRR